MSLSVHTTVMPAFTGIHDLQAAPLKEVVDTRTASGHDGQRLGSLPGLLALTAVVAGSSAAHAQQAPDLAKFDCALAEGGETVPGDRLLGDGFQIVSVGRFGQQPNVMLDEPKSSRRANCFVRQEPGREGRY